MKKFKDYINEATPTNSTGASIANYDPLLFPYDDELLSQDYQTPGQSGLAKWRFSNVWPVEKLSMAGVDAQVAASKEFLELEAQKVVNKMKRTYQQFMGVR